MVHAADVGVVADDADGIFVDAADVADVDEAAEVDAVDGENETADALLALDVSAVVFDGGRDAVLRGVVGDFAAGVRQQRKIFVKLFHQRVLDRTAACVVTGERHAKLRGDVDMPFDACDFLFDLFRIAVRAVAVQQEIGAECVAGQRNIRVFRGLQNFIDHLRVDGEIAAQRDDFHMFAAEFGDFRDDGRKIQNAAAESASQTVCAQTDFHDNSFVLDYLETTDYTD